MTEVHPVHQVTFSECYRFPLEKHVSIYHEFDDHGNHRIRLGGTRRTSRWGSYRSIVSLGKFYATTEYYCSEMPRVFHLTRGKRR